MDTPLPKHHEMPGCFYPDVKDKPDAAISHFLPPAPSSTTLVLFLTMEYFLN